MRGSVSLNRVWLRHPGSFDNQKSYPLAVTTTRLHPHHKRERENYESKSRALKEATAEITSFREQLVKTEAEREALQGALAAAQTESACSQVALVDLQAVTARV